MIATWQQLLGTWGISTNKFYVATPVSAENVAVVDAIQPNGTVSANVTLSSVRAKAGLAFRAIDANNFLSASFRNTTDAVNTLVLGKSDLGVRTSLAVLNPTTWALNTTYLMEVVLNGAQIQVYVDDVLQLTYTLTGADAAKFTTPSLVGLRMDFGATTSQDNGTSKWDNFSFTGSPVFEDSTGRLQALAGLDILGSTTGLPGGELSTKGDLLSFSTVQVRHPAGNNGEVPIWDSSATDGLRDAVLDAPGAYNDLLGWTFDPGNMTADGTLILSGAATIFLGRIPLRRQVSVTNVIAHLKVVAGSTLTHCYLAVYKSDGTLLGQTADQSSVWQSGGTTGVKTLALVGGPFLATPLAANDFLWGAIYVGTAAGTLPTFARSANNATAQLNIGCTASRSRSGTFALADTATLTTITPSSISQTAFLYLMGIS